MHAGMNDVMHVRVVGKMAELLIKIDPDKYGPHATVERGKCMLYVQLNKALYGTLQAALLFWRLLSSKLKEWGFIINPYDWCVANKMVDDKQCTVAWHVDDLKISHVSQSVVSSVIDKLNQEFGKLLPLTVTRGKIHEYLGMTIDYSIPGKVQVRMDDYIKKMLDELPPSMDGTAATPTGDHLFEVNKQNPEFLDDAMSDMFHTSVAKLLFLCKQAWPDIQTAVHSYAQG